MVLIGLFTAITQIIITLVDSIAVGMLTGVELMEISLTMDIITITLRVMEPW